MTDILWEEIEPYHWLGSVGGEVLFRVEPVQGDWYIASSLPLPLDSSTTYPSEQEAKGIAQSAVSGLRALLSALTT